MTYHLMNIKKRLAGLDNRHKKEIQKLESDLKDKNKAIKKINESNKGKQEINKKEQELNKKNKNYKIMLENKMI